MLKRKAGLIATVFLFSVSHNSYAGWSDLVNTAVKEVSDNGGGEIAKSALSNSEVVSGLKEALAKGVESAINTLGKPGGFLGNKLVEISVPDSLKSVTTMARTLGQGEYVDSFENTMNTAAEKAVPEAAVILSDAIRNMSIDDAMNILNGPDDAATQYFRKTSAASLTKKFKPIVSQATDQAGVTAAYKKLTDQATPVLGSFVEDSALNLDQYITDKSLDGLFQYIAIEEKSIRQNPAARTTGLLKKVFGE